MSAEPAEPEDTQESQGPGLRASLESILLVADEPVPVVVLAQVLERPRNEVTAVLHDLAEEYQTGGRGFDLREVAGGWRFYTREDCAAGRAVRQRRPGGPPHPGRPGDLGRGGLPPAGQPGPGVGRPGRQLRQRDADPGPARAGRGDRH